MQTERLFINDIEIDLGNTKTQFARTLQVNDIARLDNRQSNFTKNIKIPKNPTNIQTFGFLDVVGNNSNTPYELNTVKYYIDNDCIIYNGWATLTKSNPNDFEIHVYDGNVDFYKSIENKTLTDMGVSELNHLKNLSSVTQSFSSTTLPYKYIVADYNGKNTWSGTSGAVSVNIDYQIPSAKVSYLWDKCFTYSGFTYSGSVFSTPAFQNLWMTYPKPVPIETPVVTYITQQDADITYTDYVIPTDGSGGGVFYGVNENVRIFPTTISTPQISGNTVLVTGSYRLKSSGAFSVNGVQKSLVNWIVKNSSLTTTLSFGSIDAADPENNEVIIAATAGNKIFFSIDAYGGSGIGYYHPIQGSMVSYFDLIIGYDANFEEVLVDFSAKEFVNEIMQRFGLTMEKEKYSKVINFYTLDELLRSDDVLDWSDKLSSKLFETYTLGNYAQKNNFKYRYNDENDTHNDSYITINNLNLKDETTTISSKIYSPVFGSPFIGKSPQMYKFWDKEVKDDGEVQYKPLDGRFYFMRSDFINLTSPINIGSLALNTSKSITSCAVTNFNRLRFNEIIYDNYSAIQAILDKSKLLNVDLYLTSKDIAEFKFKNLVYFKQLGSYYLVNKISNFINGMSTKVELIEVDYQKSLSSTIPVDNNPTYITIDEFIVSGCDISITYSTDANIGTNIIVEGATNNFGFPVFTPPDPIYTYGSVVQNTGVTNTITFSVEAGQFWQFQMRIEGFGTSTIYSPMQYFENASTCTPYSPTGLTITDVTFLSSGGTGLLLSSAYRIDFTTEATLPRTVYYQSYNPSGSIFGGWSGYQTITAGVNSIEVNVGTLFGSPSKMQIKIGTKESNQFTI